MLLITSYLAYLGWRLTIINPNAPLLSGAYFVAECIGFLLTLAVILNSWHYRHRTPKPCLKGRSVDVFVPCYKEPYDVVRKTLIAARSIEYPHRTFMLDDGVSLGGTLSQERRKLAAELGVEYFARPKNIGSKAGNLNFGLEHSQAEFVMVFDADHIAMPHALEHTLGFFADPKVAMVQTPQDYYNTDAYQYMNRKDGALWTDQSFFYYIGLPGMDMDDSATCVGTGVVYRRSALDKIGGVPTTTVTEDLHTSIKFMKAGYKTIYINEPVAYGIAEATLHDYYRTRHRWGHGNLHVLKHENVFSCKDLTFKQRLWNICVGIHYLEGWQQLILFLLPVFALVMGYQAFEITIFNVLLVFTFPIYTYFLLQELGCGFTRFWTNEVFAMIRWPIHLISIKGLFGKQIQWGSSVKNGVGQVRWDLMTPQLAVLIISLAALAFAIFKLAQDFQYGPIAQWVMALFGFGEMAAVDLYQPMREGYTVELVAIAGFWAAFNASRVLAFVYKTVNNTRQANAFYRFRLPLAVLDKNGKPWGQIDYLAEDSLAVHCCQNTSTQVGQTLQITLVLPARCLNVKIRVTEVQDKRLVGELLWQGYKLRDQLSASLYSVDWQREMQIRQAYFATLGDFLRRLVIWRRTSKPILKWHPLLLQGKAFVLGRQNKGKANSLIAFNHMKIGQVYRGQEMRHGSPTQVAFKVLAAEPVSTLAPKGLDGMPLRRYQVAEV